WPPYLLRTLDAVRAQAGPDVSVHAEIFSPFTQFLELLGYEAALMALLEDPGRCHAILAAYARGAAEYGTFLAQADVDAVLVSSAFAGGGFISRAQYAEFVLPYERLVHQTIRARGMTTYTHTCGAIGDRLELLADTGTGGIDTLDPPPLGNVELEDAKARVGHRLFLKGNIDPVNTLLRGSVAEVRADARRRLAVGAPGSGYILSSACSVAPRVPPQNLMVLAEVSEEMGVP
ncbi:MAG: uroporphyrinogen decarboxylase family protein, partial [Armatimonadota bacterium]|nr:uroporphyrinogen decarboxylase family protein [Armatimonadota bacterium]